MMGNFAKLRWVGLAMNRMAQTGIFLIVMGGVTLTLGFFPSLAIATVTPDIGVVQILVMLAGLCLVVLGSYTVAWAIFHRGRPRTLGRDVGARLGMTGMVMSAAAMLADVMGIGTHTGGAGVFGWLQGVGMLAGFLVAMLGALIYGLARPGKSQRDG